MVIPEGMPSVWGFTHSEAGALAVSTSPVLTQQVGKVEKQYLGIRIVFTMLRGREPLEELQGYKSHREPNTKMMAR
jgi:hypothetical protein